MKTVISRDSAKDGRDFRDHVTAQTFKHGAASRHGDRPCHLYFVMSVVKTHWFPYIPMRVVVRFTKLSQKLTEICSGKFLLKTSVHAH